MNLKIAKNIASFHIRATNYKWLGEKLISDENVWRSSMNHPYQLCGIYDKKEVYVCYC